MSSVQIYSQAAKMFMVCFSLTAVRMSKVLPTDGSGNWIVTTIAAVNNGSIICCEKYDACITIGADRQPADHEPLVLKRRKQNSGQVYFWKVIPMENDNYSNVFSMDGTYSWDVHTDWANISYIDKMGIQLFLYSNNENQRFEFRPIHNGELTPIIDQNEANTEQNYLK